MPRFTRGQQGGARAHSSNSDEPGNVVVRVYHSINESSYNPAPRTRSRLLRVEAARVEEVAFAIEGALFDDNVNAEEYRRIRRSPAFTEFLRGDALRCLGEDAEQRLRALLVRADRALGAES